MLARLQAARATVSVEALVDLDDDLPLGSPRLQTCKHHFCLCRRKNLVDYLIGPEASHQIHIGGTRRRRPTFAPRYVFAVAAAEGRHLRRLQV
jgi:hypothetical protein